MNTKKTTGLTLFFASVMFLIQTSVPAMVPADLSKSVIIPKPVSVTVTKGTFVLKAGMAISINVQNEEVERVAQFLADKLKTPTGFDIKVLVNGKAPKAGSIFLTLTGNSPDPVLGEEGYKIIISKKLITVSANTAAGLFHGIQTIRQLLPAEIEMSSKQKGQWEIPAGTITDYPVYSYRGMMLDVSRHFFDVDDVKRVIDFLALYKMDVLHLGLSNDQGWRIEIKSWPELARHGGSTEVGGGKGGFYTQKQYSEIVNYAKERYIVIVPEIDMPGHSNAALASYAELNCDGKATELYTGTKVGFSTFCTTLDITYQFIDDVVRELAAITPGPYIHIGGDESHSTKTEDYIPFIKKVQDIVISHDKKIIGWDEIAISTLKAGATAQHWASVKNANLAVSQGAKILMSPAVKAYMDMQYDKTTKLGLHWAAYIEVDSAYIWNPETYIPGVGKENILGIEAALWTETITNMDEIEYMVFPRLPGFAEIGWTPSHMRNWDEYKIRLGSQDKRFKAMGIDYYPSKLVPWSGK